MEHQLAQAFADWNEHRLYHQVHRGGGRSYRLKATGRIAPYSKLLLSLFEDTSALNYAAKQGRQYVAPVA